MRNINGLIVLAMMLLICSTAAAKLARIQQQMSLAEINEIQQQDDSKKTAGQLDQERNDSKDEKNLNAQEEKNTKTSQDSTQSSKDSTLDEKNKDNSKGSEEVVENNPKISKDEEQILQQLGEMFQGLQEFLNNGETQNNQIVEKTEVASEKLVNKEEEEVISPKELITQVFGNTAPQSSELTPEEKELTADLQQLTEKQLFIDFNAIPVNSLTNTTTLEDSIAKDHPSLSQSRIIKRRFNWGAFMSCIVVIGFIAALLYAAQALGKRQHQRNQSKQLYSPGIFIRDYEQPQKVQQQGYYSQENYYQVHSEYAQPLI